MRRRMDPIKIAGEPPECSPEWFDWRMDIIARRGRDPEDMHRQADQLMCRMLEFIGCRAGVERFRRMAKWYS